MTIARHSSTGFLAFLGHAPYEELVELIAEALTTARREARAAAFKEAVNAARSMFHNSEVNHSRWNVAVVEIVKTIEAAANTEEGGGDG